jgi:hypothetical protein
MIKSAKKRKLLAVIFAIYFTFILVSTIPYLAEQDLFGTRSEEDSYESHLVFQSDGEFGHFKNVVLTNNLTAGKIDLKFTFDTNTLYIQKMENIKELDIDCQLMYKNKYKELFGKEPSTLETADIFENNGGLFTVIINTNTPMDKLQFVDTPMPKKVLVNKANWWETQTSYYYTNENNITVSFIPKGATTVEVYFKDVVKTHPNAFFSASNYIALRNETIAFDASGSSDEDGYIVDYIWDLGDTNKDSGKKISHSYSSVENYTVELMVRDDDELIDYFHENISVIDSNKSFQKVVVDEVEIDIRSVTPQNLSIKRETEVPEIPETSGEDFNFFLNITTNQTNVSRFQLKIDIGFIGGDIIPMGTNPDSIKLFYYDEDTNKWVEIEDSYYDPTTGILTAVVDHLTVFAPMSNEAASKQGGEEDDDEGFTTIIVILVLILVIIIILSIIGILIKKKKSKDKGKEELDEDEEKDEDDADDEIEPPEDVTEDVIESPKDEVRKLKREAKASRPTKSTKKTKRTKKLPIRGPPKGKKKDTDKTKVSGKKASVQKLKNSVRKNEKIN